MVLEITVIFIIRELLEGVVATAREEARGDEGREEGGLKPEKWRF